NEVELWAFNHGSNQWVHYGAGIVNADGLTATSRPGEGLPFTGWSANVPVITVVAVKRRLAGYVTDADGHSLHGVEIRESGGKTVWTDYNGDTLSGVTGLFHIDEAIVGYNRYQLPGGSANFIDFIPITDTFIGIERLSLK